MEDVTCIHGIYEIGDKKKNHLFKLPYKRTTNIAMQNARNRLASLGFGQEQEAFLVKECYTHGYRLTNNELGEGEYAKVRLAQVLSWKVGKLKSYFRGMKETNRLVAIKIIDKRVIPREFLQRFLPRELSNHCLLPYHPNVIQIFEHFWSSDHVFVVLEYCEKGDLLDLINSNLNTGHSKGLDESLSRKIFRQICHGLMHMHKYNIVHRDLKCENILLTHDMNVRITDLGFSCQYTDRNCFLKTPCGSYTYSAPEVIKHKLYDGFKADIWSLGVILFSMANGKLPFEDRNLDEMDGNMKMQRLSFDPSVSYDLRILIRSVLQYNPLLRPCLAELIKDVWVTQNMPSEASTTTVVSQQHSRLKSVNPQKGCKSEEYPLLGSLSVQDATQSSPDISAKTSQSVGTLKSDDKANLRNRTIQSRRKNFGQLAENDCFHIKGYSIQHSKKHKDNRKSSVLENSKKVSMWLPSASLPAHSIYKIQVGDHKEDDSIPDLTSKDDKSPYKYQGPGIIQNPSCSPDLQIPLMLIQRLRMEGNKELTDKKTEHEKKKPQSAPASLGQTSGILAWYPESCLQYVVKKVRHAGSSKKMVKKQVNSQKKKQENPEQSFGMGTIMSPTCKSLHRCIKPKK